MFCLLIYRQSPVCLEVFFTPSITHSSSSKLSSDGNRVSAVTEQLCHRHLGDTLKCTEKREMHQSSAECVPARVFFLIYTFPVQTVWSRNLLLIWETSYLSAIKLQILNVYKLNRWYPFYIVKILKLGSWI